MATLQGRIGLTWLQMQAEFLVFKKRLESQHALKTNQSFTPAITVNMAQSQLVSSFGNRSFNQTSRFSSPQRSVQHFVPRGSYRGRGRGRWQGNSRPVCQVCGKLGHSANICYHRFDKQFVLSPHGHGRGQHTHFTPRNPTQTNEHSASSHAMVATQNPSVAVASPKSVIDPAWYVDSGASNHVTADYTNLAQSSTCGGK